MKLTVAILSILSLAACASSGTNHASRWPASAEQTYPLLTEGASQEIFDLGQNTANEVMMERGFAGLKESAEYESSEVQADSVIVLKELPANNVDFAFAIGVPLPSPGILQLTVGDRTITDSLDYSTVSRLKALGQRLPSKDQSVTISSLGLHHKAKYEAYTLGSSLVRCFKLKAYTKGLANEFAEGLQGTLPQAFCRLVRVESQ